MCFEICRLLVKHEIPIVFAAPVRIIMMMRALMKLFEISPAIQ